MKRSLLRALGELGEWRAHPMFTEAVTREDAEAFSRLVGVPLLAVEALTPRTDRMDYLASARECRHHVFLDPDTGLRLKRTRPGLAPAYLFGDELLTIANARPRSLTLVYDQSLSHGSAAKELEAKILALQERRLPAAAYLSHACFILVSPDSGVLARAVAALRQIGLPAHRLLQQPELSGDAPSNLHD